MWQIYWLKFCIRKRINPFTALVPAEYNDLWIRYYIKNKVYKKNGTHRSSVYWIIFCIVLVLLYGWLGLVWK